ncbi:MAG: signal peptidase II [Planctomycetota bacterium]
MTEPSDSAAGPDAPAASPPPTEPAGAASSAGDTPRPPVRTALTSPVAWILLLVTIVIGLASDLWTKHVAFERVAGDPVVVLREDVLESHKSGVGLGVLIPPHDPIEAIPNALNFTLVLNPGAVFGIGAGKRWVFVGFTVAAIAFAGWMFAKWTGPRDRWAHAAIGLLVAGGLGNLYDRITFACVRDFIHPLPGWKLPFGIQWPNGSDEVWPYVSNVADAYLMLAIGILLIISLKKPKPAKAESGDTPNAPPKA